MRGNSAVDKIEVTPEMFVELEEFIKEKMEDEFTIVSDEWESDRLCPRRRVILKDQRFNLYVIVDQRIYPESLRRDEIKIIFITKSEIARMMES